MLQKRNKFILLIGVLISLLLAGCEDSNPGEDAITKLDKPSAPPMSYAECTESCHARDGIMDPVDRNGTGNYGKHVKHVEEKQYPCQTCHLDYHAALPHRSGELDTADPAVTLARFINNPDNTVGNWVNDTGAQTGGCSNVYCHGQSVTPGWYSTETFQCVGCHTPGSPIDPLTTSGTGIKGKHLKHVGIVGLTCETCHLDYGSKLATATSNYIYSMGNFKYGHSGTDPSDDTTKETDPFVFFDTSIAGAGASYIDNTNTTGAFICSISCHPTEDADSTDAANWYTTEIPRWDCVVCHSYAQTQSGDSTVKRDRRQVFGTTADFASTSSVSHHIKSGTPAPDQCRVCHNMGLHRSDGRVRLRNADSSTDTIDSTTDFIVWKPGTVDTTTDRLNRETFCLSCHDSDGSLYSYDASSGGSPFNPFAEDPTTDDVLGQPPYTFALNIKSSWEKSFGHGRNGGHATADHLTCVGSGVAGSGCHGRNGQINAHASTSEVITANNFSYSNKYSDPSGEIYQENWFALCFDCHQNYPGKTKKTILGVKEGGPLDHEYGTLKWWDSTADDYVLSPPYQSDASNPTTKFSDHDVDGDPFGLNDGFFWSVDSPSMNLHWFHIGLSMTNFRGTTTDCSSTIPNSCTSIVCVNCHNVHGSNDPWAALYEELGYDHSTDVNSNQFGEMTSDAYLINGYMEGNPTFCDKNCHYIQGETRAWFYDPSVDL